MPVYKNMILQIRSFIAETENNGGQTQWVKRPTGFILRVKIGNIKS
jgi:hypothetical protein